MHAQLTRLLGALAAGAIWLSLAGCRQDMQDQPKYVPLRESDFFGDMRSARTLPAGVVARDHLNEDTYLYTGKINGNLGAVFPFPITGEDMKRGQERYTIYCTPCHSPLGDGDGTVVQRGYKRPPAYTDPKVLNTPVGHYFDVMTNGYGAMPDYAAQIGVEDRWRIAAYIRALQLSQKATLADVPPKDRNNLQETKPVTPLGSVPPQENSSERGEGK